MAGKNVELTFVGSNGDALAGTDLVTAPEDGYLYLWVACDAGTTSTLQFSAPPDSPAANLITIKNNGVNAPVNLLQDTPYILPVLGGSKPRVQLVIGAATLLRLVVIFVP